MIATQSTRSEFPGKAFLLLAIVAVAALSIAWITISNHNSPTVTSDEDDYFPPFDARIEKCSTCVLASAELRHVTSYSPYVTTYSMNVTGVVKYVDGWRVSYDKHYVLRLHFNDTLQKGDGIVIYARYASNPSHKTARLLLTNGTQVGSVEMTSHWGYYTINITSNIPPTSVFDISIDGTNPSSNDIRIDQAKCILHAPVGWHDVSTGELVTSYSIALNYMVTASGVDASSVYLDLSISQMITNSISSAVIVPWTEWQMAIIHVPSLGSSHLFVSNSSNAIGHVLAGTDTITMTFNVTATAYGKISGTEDWISTSESFNAIRSMSLAWY